jgi:predicted Fe-S protein YdhL (DUF1289 family)
MKVVLVTSILLLAYVSVSRNRPKKLGTVPSPCVKVCRIDNDGFCVGCKRTLDEIREWCIMSEYEQQKLLFELKWRQDAT